MLKSESKFGWGVTDLIREIREGAKLTPEPAPKDRIEGENIPTVSALLMKSTNILDEFTRDCFAFLGAFAPRPATFDLSAMKAVWAIDDPKPIVRKLVAHGLLEPADAGRFQMHRIPVDHAKSLCS